MKLRSYLMLSYLVVMVLPLLALYLIYTGLQQFWHNENQQLEASARASFQDLESLLTDPAVYQIHELDYFEPIQEKTNDSLKVNLYRYDGLILYQSQENHGRNYYSFKQTTEIYEQLGQIQTRPNGFIYKNIVLHQGEPVGIYEISSNHSQWRAAYEKYSLLYFGLFSFVFLIIYFTILYFLHKKLNHPIKQLESQMTQFANGEPSSEPPDNAVKEIKQLHQHFEEMKHTLTAQQKQLQQEQQEKESIVRSLSHDLKTPLTVIRTYSEALWKQQYLTEKETSEYKEIVLNKLDYTEQLINDLSMYSTIQSSHYQTEFVDVDGEEFFEMLLTSYEELGLEKQLHIETFIDTDQHYKLDPKQMSRIVDNLVDNAVRHTERGQAIHLILIASSCRLPDTLFSPFHSEIQAFRGTDTLLLVQNEGSYIPSDQLELVQKPFYQVEQARTKGSSGLGLSIAKLLIEKQAGQLKIWSDPNQGTLIACRIPERKD